MIFDSFWLALQFLTRLPTPKEIQFNDRALGYSILFYPVIGLIIGLALILVQALLQDQSMLLQASMLLFTWTLITGCLHLDGLADSADAWIGGQGDAKQSLKIMKDPNSGPVAVSAITLVLLIKFSSLTQIANRVEALLFIPMLARASVHYIVLSTKYVRDQGLGSPLIQNMPKTWVMGALMVSVLLAFIFLGIWPTLAAMLMAWLLRHMMIKRLGGFSGDTLGASIEIIETTLLFVCALTSKA